MIIVLSAFPASSSAYFGIHVGDHAIGESEHLAPVLADDVHRLKAVMRCRKVGDGAVSSCRQAYRVFVCSSWFQ